MMRAHKWGTGWGPGSVAPVVACGWCVGVALLALVGAATPTPVRAAGGTYYVGSTDGTTSVTTGCVTDFANTTCTLRGALAQNATDGGGGTVSFGSTIPAATVTTIDIGGGTLTLANDVTIDGTGQAGGDQRGLHGETAVVHGETSGVTVSSVTGTDADRAATPSGTSGGGGIYNNGGTMTVTNSTLSGNSAINGGGGIYNNGGTVTVTNSTLSGNSATNGGGGIYNNGGTVTVTNSTLSGNSASTGGGIYNGGTVNATNTLIVNNTACDCAS